MSAQVQLVDEDTLLGAIAEVRKDDNPNDWVVAGHRDDKPNELEYVASGPGGIDALKSNLSDNRVMYALLRTTEQIDKSLTVKFVYIYFVGEGVPFAKRGRYGVIKGETTKTFQPFHVSFEISSANEIDANIIKEKIAEASGTAVRHAQADSKNQRSFLRHESTHSHGPTSGKGPSVAAQVKEQLVVDEEVMEAIKNLRHDKNQKWILATYASLPQRNEAARVVLAGAGTGDEEEWRKLLDNEKITYGLFRLTDQIDKSSTVKFVFLQFIGRDVPPMAKAKVSTLHAAVKERVGASHVDIISSDQKELSESVFLAKVQSARG